MARSLLAAALAAVLLGVVASTTAGATIPYPDSIAAIGDSWTSPLCTDATCRKRPANSWSTGSNPAVRSHYAPILAANPRVRDQAYDIAADDWNPGPQMADLDLQASLAIAKKPDYVTIFLGGNDICSGTTVATFRRELRDGLAKLAHGLPNARIFLASLDDLTREWVVMRGNLGVCGLGAHASAAQLAALRGRIVSFNGELAEACALLPRCRYDGGAVFRMTWKPSYFSPYDPGHLSIAGQRALAAVTWQATFPFGR